MREWLNRYRYQWYRVEDLIAELNSGVQSVDYDGMPKSHHIRRLDDDVVHRELISKELEYEIEKLAELRKEITSVIDLIEDKTVARVMHMRYIELLEWSEIVDRLNYSRGHVFKLHRDGLSMIVNITN